MRRVVGVFAGASLVVLWLGACEKRRDEPERTETAAGEVRSELDEAGKKIERGADKLGDKAEGLARDVGEGARDAAKDAKELGADAADKAGEAAHDVGDAAKRGVHELGEAGERAGDTTKRGVHELGEAGERAGEGVERSLTPAPVPGAEGRVGAERGLTASELATKATQETQQRLGTCDLSQPLYFFFDPASAEVPNAELTRMNQLTGCLSGRSAPAGVTIITYGDTSTDPKRNLELGLDRASNVARLLIRSGTPPKQITLQAVGETSAERDASGKEGGNWARRVAVRIAQ